MQLHSGSLPNESQVLSGIKSISRTFGVFGENRTRKPIFVTASPVIIPISAPTVAPTATTGPIPGTVKAAVRIAICRTTVHAIALTAAAPTPPAIAPPNAFIT